MVLNTFSIKFWLPKAAYPMINTTNSFSYRRFDGDEVQTPDPSIALGGIQSYIEFLPEQFLPLLQASEPRSIPWTNDFADYRLFRDITAAEATAGITLYRGLFVSMNDTDPPTANMDVYIRDDADGATISLGTEAVQYTFNDPAAYVQRIANETTAPAGVVFSAPTLAAPLSLGPMSDMNTPVFLWFKLVIAPGAASKMYDIFTLGFANNVDQAQTSFFHTVGSGITSATVSGTLDGGIVQHPYGETYTITTTNSSGTLVDPPSNTVMVYTADSFTNPVYQNRYKPGVASGSVIGQAIKVSTGIYRFRFTPDAPGYYYLTFDCGGEIQANRGVEVTPVV